MIGLWVVAVDGVRSKMIAHGHWIVAGDCDIFLHHTDTNKKVIIRLNFR